MLKTSAASKIAQVIRSTHVGKSILEPEVTGKIMTRMREKNENKLHDQLTNREREILLLIAAGKKPRNSRIIIYCNKNSESACK